MQSQGREVETSSASWCWSIHFLQKTLPYNSIYVIASLRCDRNNIPHWQHQSPSAQRSYISNYIGKSDESQVSPTVGDYLESPCCFFAPFCSHFSPPLSSARTKWWLLTYLLTYLQYLLLESYCNDSLSSNRWEAARSYGHTPQLFSSSLNDFRKRYSFTLTCFLNQEQLITGP